jgi:hypothetical protein
LLKNRPSLIEGELLLPWLSVCVNIVDSEAVKIQELIAETDSLVLDDRWDEVVALRDRCRIAVQRGHQWWPAAAWAEYRMALDGPGVLAASVLDSAAARYTLGPFPEVAASTHAWDELAPYLPGTPGAAAFAHECIAMGDDLRADDQFASLPVVFDLPPFLQEWEPQYGPVTYHLDRVEHLIAGSVGEDDLCNDRVVCPVETDGLIPDSTTVDALIEMVQPWAHDSSNRVKAIACTGDAGTVLELLEIRGVVPVEVSGSDALQSLAWLGASGGPTGRRRGSSSARSNLWWLLLQLTGLGGVDEELTMATAHPSELTEFADAIRDLRWTTWAAARASSPLIVDGWNVRLIVEDPAERLAWGLQSQLRPTTTRGQLTSKS